MSAASLVFKECRVYVKEVEKSKTVHKDITGLKAKMVSEEDIKIRCASPEKEDLVFIVNTNVFRKPLPVFDLEVR